MQGSAFIVLVMLAVMAISGIVFLRMCKQVAARGTAHIVSRATNTLWAKNLDSCASGQNIDELQRSLDRTSSVFTSLLTLSYGLIRARPRRWLELMASNYIFALGSLSSISQRAHSWVPMQVLSSARHVFRWVFPLH